MVGMESIFVLLCNLARDDVLSLFLFLGLFSRAEKDFEGF